MSWHLSVTGKSSKLAEVVKEKFEKTGGCPKGSAEEAAKNTLGQIAESLCKSLATDMAITITASGSAWNEGDKARSQACEFKLSTHSEFLE